MSRCEICWWHWSHSVILSILDGFCLSNMLWWKVTSSWPSKTSVKHMELALPQQGDSPGFGKMMQIIVSPWFLLTFIKLSLFCLDQWISAAIFTFMSPNIASLIIRNVSLQAEIIPVSQENESQATRCKLKYVLLLWGLKTVILEVTIRCGHC